eukprot:scaffold24690_cov33-Tisochrysis_lutea.AAC.2
MPTSPWPQPTSKTRETRRWASSRAMCVYVSADSRISFTRQYRGSRTLSMAVSARAGGVGPRPARAPRPLQYRKSAARLSSESACMTRPGSSCPDSPAPSTRPVELRVRPGKPSTNRSSENARVASLRGTAGLYHIPLR